MSTTTFDSLATARALEQAGMDPAHAEGVTEAISGAVSSADTVARNPYKSGQGINADSVRRILRRSRPQAYPGPRVRPLALGRLRTSRSCASAAETGRTLARPPRDRLHSELAGRGAVARLR